MEVGDYKISNSLIGAVLVTTVLGLSVATGATGAIADSVSDVFTDSEQPTQAEQSPDNQEEVSDDDSDSDSTDGDDGSDSNDQDSSDENDQDGSDDTQNVDDSNDDSNQDDSNSDSSEGDSSSDEDSNQDNSNDNQQNTDDSNQDSDDGTQDGQGSETTGSISLQGDAVAEQPATVEVSVNGEPVQTTIYVNNDEVGTSSSTGTATFTVPNTQEITLSADADVGTETYTVDGYSSGDGGDESSDPEPLNAMYNLDPTEPVAGQEVSFDASESSGTNIQGYTWSSPDTTLDETSGKTITHEFSNSGSYDIQLEVEGGDQGTDTQSAEITVNEAPTPDFNFREPADGSQFENTSLDYDFTVFNAISGAGYEIIAGGNTISSGTLEEGQNDIQKEVNVPDGNFDTHIEVDQGGSTVSSETHSVEAGYELPDPEFQINSPSGGQTVQAYADPAEVVFQYEVNNAGWADTAKIDIQDSSKEASRTISTGDSVEETIELPAAEDSTTYNYELILTGQGKETSKSASFNHEEVPPNDVVNIDNIEVQDNGFETHFNISMKSNRERVVDFHIEENDRPLIKGSPSGDPPYEWNTSTIHAVEYAGTYTAKFDLEDKDGDVVATTSQEFTTTADGADAPPDGE